MSSDSTPQLETVFGTQLSLLAETKINPIFFKKQRPIPLQNYLSVKEPQNDFFGGGKGKVCVEGSRNAGGERNMTPSFQSPVLLPGS